jgi:hypothetical protein
VVFRRVGAGHAFRNTVLSLASDEARNITDVALPVDAGALSR